MDALYPHYGFARHVGYITPGHSAVVRERGPCEIHRRSFQALCYAGDAGSRPRQRRSTVSIGRAGERRVRLHYRLRGYRILAANVRSGGVEVDLVARRGRRLVFCEVKAKGGAGVRRPARDGRPPRSRSASRARRRRGWRRDPTRAALEVSFEVVALRGRRLERVRNAF